MANPYSLFLNLLPKDSKIIAKVVSVSIDGTTVVTIPGSNNNISVRGDGSNTYAVNDHVYIVNGVITGKSPALQVVIEQELI